MFQELCRGVVESEFFVRPPAHDILRAGAGNGNEIGRYGAHGLKKRAWERASSDGGTRAACSKSARGCSDCLAALCSSCSLQIISTPVFAFAMSQSPSASISNISEANSKKRKAPHPNSPGMAAEGPASPQQSSAHIPKRGARACTSCRKGKNRCEGEVGDFCSRRYPRSVRSLRPASPVPGPALCTTGSLSSLPS